ncbi:MAG: 3-oxoacyl-ACP synthase III [Dehalococcoidia bacterium]|nr:3-oxoacyl-ACP synthase III [Dehalococcoidia bacterium]
MHYRRVCIEAFGYELPQRVITSQSLEERLAPVYAKVHRTVGRLEQMTGIRERREWEEGTPPSLPSTKAAEKAIAAAGIDKKDIECLLHTSVSRDFLEPATATVVHNALGLPPTATIFDISNACLGFVNGMVTLANMIELGQIKAGVVVACESGTRLTEATIQQLLQDPDITRAKVRLGFASLTMGSGAVSVVMTHSSISKSGHKLLGGVVRTASQHNDLCRVDADTCFYDPESFPSMHANSEGILRNGMQLAMETWECFQREMGWRPEDVDKIFTHQVSAVHQALFFETLKLDKAKGFSTVEYLGNIGSVSLPVSVAIGVEQGHLKPGDRAAMMAAGSGLNCIMLGLEW